MTDGIYRLLRQVADERFESNFTWLADTLGMSVQSVSKYVHVDPRRRTNPSPVSCVKIAQALQLDCDLVLELAGHRPPRAPLEQLAARRRGIHEQLEDWISAVGPQYEEWFWRHLKAQGDSTVALIHGLEVAVSTDAGAAVSAADLPPNGVPREKQHASEGPLTTRQRRVHAALNLAAALFQRLIGTPAGNPERHYALQLRAQ